jgi:hypothetical protein
VDALVRAALADMQPFLAAAIRPPAAAQVLASARSRTGMSGPHLCSPCAGQV